MKHTYTYIYPPQFTSHRPWITRIISSILKNVTFLDLNNNSILNTIKSEYDAYCFHPIFYRKAFPTYFYSCLKSGYYNSLLDNISTDSILLTINCYEDLFLAKYLLSRQYRVCIGGPYINIMGASIIRNLLPYSIGNRLMVYEGYLSSYEDLSLLLSRWSDVKVYNDIDFSSYWNHKKDYYSGSSDPHSPIHIGFETKCNYSKCKFCTFKQLPYCSFISDASISSIVDNVSYLSSYYNTSVIRLIDSLFTPSQKKVEILSSLRKLDLYTICYSSIPYLAKLSYIEFLNLCTRSLLIGLESTNDYSLRAVGKGYTYDIIKKAISNIKNKLSRRISLNFSIMLDLPVGGVSEIKKNYDNIEKIKADLISSGFKVNMTYHPLSLSDNKELLNTTHYDCIEYSEEYLCGGEWVNHHIGQVIPNLQYVPYIRRDSSGNPIKSDIIYLMN